MGKGGRGREGASRLERGGRGGAYIEELLVEGLDRGGSGGGCGEGDKAEAAGLAGLAVRY